MEPLNFRQLLWRTTPHQLGLGGVQSKSAGLQPCLDVDETRSETSDGSLSVTSRCADVDLRVIGILVQAESMTVNDEGQLNCGLKVAFLSGRATTPPKL